MMRIAIVLGVASWWLFGCPVASGVVVDGGALVLDAGVSQPDAGPIVDAGSSLRYFVVGLLLDGGAQPLLIATDEVKSVEVESWRGLTVSFVALRDYRIRVIDSADQIVPSDDTATELDGGLTYVIAFAQPLRPGKSYALTLEAQAGAQFIDSAGRPWDDVRLSIKVRGQPDPEPGRKPAKKKKKH